MPDNRLLFTYRAVVHDVGDPENLKRVKLIIPSVFGPDQVSGWAWPVTTGGTAPAVNTIVYAIFENGDPNNPLYFNPPAAGAGGALLAANNLSDLASASAARTALGLGTAATTASTAYDAAGAATAAQAAAIAASAQRSSNLSDLSNVSTARTNLGLKSAAIENRAFWKPSDNNLLGAPYDPVLSGSSATFTAGTPSLCKVTLPDGGTIANVLYTITTAGATLTSGQNFVGVYSTAGVLLGVSADQSTNFAGSFVNRTAALTLQSGQSLTIAAGGSVYIAVLFNGTTSPTFQRGGTQNITNNIGLSAPNLRFCASATGSQTTMPGTITMSSTTSTSGYFAAVS